MNTHFEQIQWDSDLQYRCRQLIRLAIQEDLGRGFDWTTVSLVPAGAIGTARIVARQSGVIAGLEAAKTVVDETQSSIQWHAVKEDGDSVVAHETVAKLEGSARDLLTIERTALNFVGHLSGIATLTNSYVQTVSHTRASIYDTRKTTPGWRELEKYAVRCGGGTNHRRGLYDAVLIKDNHLAFGRAGDDRYGPADAVRRVRDMAGEATDKDGGKRMPVEIEVDDPRQLKEVLAANPDIVLLDNLSTSQLSEAVELRDKVAPHVLLEASGGVRLSTVASIAETGVDRISVGAITHSAPSFDVSLDWRS